MPSPPQVVNDHWHTVFDQPRVERIAIHLVRLSLNELFETSFGSIDSRLIFLVSVEGEGLTGWGEVVAAEAPRYSYETVGTAQHVIRGYLAPAMLSRPIAGLADLAARLAPFRGHNMAKATARWRFRAGRDSDSRLISIILLLTLRRLSASNTVTYGSRGQNEQL